MILFGVHHFAWQRYLSRLPFSPSSYNSPDSKVRESMWGFCQLLSLSIQIIHSGTGEKKHRMSLGTHWTYWVRHQPKFHEAPDLCKPLFKLKGHNVSWSLSESALIQNPYPSDPGKSDCFHSFSVRVPRVPLGKGWREILAVKLLDVLPRSFLRGTWLSLHSQCPGSANWLTSLD